MIFFSTLPLSISVVISKSVEDKSVTILMKSV